MIWPKYTPRDNRLLAYLLKGVRLRIFGVVRIGNTMTPRPLMREHIWREGALLLWVWPLRATMSRNSTTDKEAISVVVDDVSQPPLYHPDVDTSTIDERRLLRKIDLRVVPWLAVLYLLNFLDRGNIGNARVCLTLYYNCWTHVLTCLAQLYHMQDDLHITDKQYLIALTVFFFPYSLFEVY